MSEDWIGGYILAKEKISWRNGIRFIINIEDGGLMERNIVKKINIIWRAP